MYLPVRIVGILREAKRCCVSATMRISYLSHLTNSEQPKPKASDYDHASPSINPLERGERLETAGGTVRVHTWEGMIHVFPSNIANLRAAKQALDDIGRFLRQQCFATIRVSTRESG